MRNRSTATRADPDACPGRPSWQRHLLLFVPSGLLAGAVTALALRVLGRAPHAAFDWLLAIPFSLAAAWESVILWQIVLGFAVWTRGSRGLPALERRASAIEPLPATRSRTAVLIPIHEEDAVAVFARVRVMLRSLAVAGQRRDIDVHILSDTRSDDVLLQERREWARAAAEWPEGVIYSHRAVNTGRKAGNIQAFLGREGGTYDFAIVLDADSLMSGATMRRLIRLMEEHPRIGLIQTVSFAAGRETLFARIQQFAVRLHAPLALRGLDVWHGREASYWGHNAIIRIAPFRVHCRLPVLPGKPPFGGEILCHDIVEGALLVGAGWEVHLLPTLDGTWEEMPTNVLDLVDRDRRWCQGNLQHVRLLTFPGLRAAGRAHLALGIGGYLAAPLWWTFLILGVARVVTGPPDHLGLLALGLTEPGAAAGALVAVNLVFLIAPRLLNLFCALLDTRVRRSFGGSRCLLVGAALEQAFSFLLGPALSLITTGSVLKVMAGRSIRWTGQTRADRVVSAAEAFRCHAGHVALGAVLAVVALRTGGWYAVWMAPVVSGLLLSPVLTVLSSRVTLGRMSRRLGLFRTVDDTDHHPELRELDLVRWPPGGSSPQRRGASLGAGPETVAH